MIDATVTPQKYTDYLPNGGTRQVPYWRVKVLERSELLGFDVLYSEPSAEDVKNVIDWVLEQNRIPCEKDYV